MGGHADMLDDALVWLVIFIAVACDDLDGRFFGFGRCFCSDVHKVLT